MKNKEEETEEKNIKKRIIISVIGFIFIAFVIWVIILNLDNSLNYTVTNIDGVDVYDIDGVKYMESDNETNLVKIDVKDKGIMVAELYPDIAPITVKNFKKLVSEKFYDGLTFHRVIKDFMIQTGDPTATGSGGSDENIKGEFELNGVENPLSHVRGVLSMARRGSNPDTEETMNSASSQFFIVHKDSPHLDGNYAAFGQIVSGIEVVDLVAEVATDEYDKPLSDVIINSIRFANEYEGE